MSSCGKWQRIQWNRENAELANKPFEDLFERKQAMTQHAYAPGSALTILAFCTDTGVPFGPAFDRPTGRRLEKWLWGCFARYRRETGKRPHEDIENFRAWLVEAYKLPAEQVAALESEKQS